MILYTAERLAEMLGVQKSTVQQLRLPTTSASALMTLWSIPSSYNHSTTTPVP